VKDWQRWNYFPRLPDSAHFRLSHLAEKGEKLAAQEIKPSKTGIIFTVIGILLFIVAMAPPSISPFAFRSSSSFSG